MGRYYQTDEERINELDHRPEGNIQNEDHQRDDTVSKIET